MTDVLDDKPEERVDERMNIERKYLESLLKDRFNFFLVFTSLIIAAIAGSDLQNPRLEQLVYFSAFFVSLSFWCALTRTNFLVNRALDALPEGEAYKKLLINKKPKAVLRANNFIIGTVPLMIVITFGALLYGSYVDYGFFPPSSLPAPLIPDSCRQVLLCIAK